MKLTTQDGHTIELHRWDKPVFGAPRFNRRYNDVYCTLVDAAGKPIKYHGYIGRYFNEAKAKALVAELKAAWAAGVNEFTMPANTDPDPVEVLEAFAHEHHLTLCAINEVGYSRADEIRNRRLWESSDYFERRNIIICDEYGSYERSLAKWRNLNGGKVA